VTCRVSPSLFFVLSAAWFGLIGPAVALPIPSLVLASYGSGGLPAVTTGLLFALVYRHEAHSGSRIVRAALGGGIGAVTAGVGFAAVVSVHSWLFDPRHGVWDSGPLMGVFLLLSTACTFAGFGLFAGAVCGALFPRRLLQFAVRGNQSAA
jgi:hypothetical protein